MDTKSMLEKLKQFLETEEGIESMKRFSEGLKKEEEFNNRWNNKFTEFLSNKSDSELDVLYNKYIKHAEKIRTILYKRCIDGESEMNNYILESIKTLGNECSEDNFGMFTTCMYEWKGYIGEMYCGQGCFISIRKNE